MENLALNILFGLVGGLALFLYGMKLLSEGLQKAAGNKLKTIFEHLTSRPIKGIMTGAFITSLVQSSSITTVTLVGLINAGLITLTQAITVIMGANIGTTITAQLVAFKIGKYSLPIIAMGTLFLFLAKKKKYYYLAQIFLGFGILFLGMDIMGKGAAPLREFPFFIDMLISFGEIVLLGVLAGAFFTAIIQSSSATTALVISLSMENIIGIKAAVAIIIGANIGTCVTALLASISTSLSARRAAFAHTLFNILGAVIFLPLINILIKITTFLSGELPRQIANAHTIFNITTTFLMVPFIPLLVIAVKKLVPGKEHKVDHDTKFLDKRLLNTPAIAIAQANKEMQRMASLTIEMLEESTKTFLENKKDMIQLVSKKEEAVDNIHNQMDYYLKKISESSITKQQSKKVADLFHVINDIERVGDHATNLIELAEKKLDAKLHFSKQAQEELEIVSDETIKSYKLAIQAMNKKDKKLAMEASKLEDKIDDQVERFEMNHLKRLKKKACNPALGIVFVEVLKNLERVSDHANNIASSVILSN